MVESETCFQKYRQSLSVKIKGKTHDSCLNLAKLIKMQCEVWFFCVEYKETKSARKGSVLERQIMIYQEAYSEDIIIFKETTRRICSHYNSLSEGEILFTDKGVIPVGRF